MLYCYVFMKFSMRTSNYILYLRRVLAEQTRQECCLYKFDVIISLKLVED
jgi:hypothetical protein